MGRKIVPLRPRQKKDSPGAPTPLTLADIAITWTEGQSTWATRHYVTGASLARAVLYLRHRHPHTIEHDPHTIEHDPLGGDVGPVPSYLRGLSYIVFPDAGAPSEDLEKEVRYTLSEYLDDLAARMRAADSAEPAKCIVHVGPIPAEWTK
jgi:hypothetical protein